MSGGGSQSGGDDLSDTYDTSGTSDTDVDEAPALAGVRAQPRKAPKTATSTQGNTFADACRQHEDYVRRRDLRDEGNEGDEDDQGGEGDQGDHALALPNMNAVRIGAPPTCPASALPESSGSGDHKGMLRDDEYMARLGKKSESAPTGGNGGKPWPFGGPEWKVHPNYRSTKSTFPPYGDHTLSPLPSQMSQPPQPSQPSQMSQPSQSSQPSQTLFRDTWHPPFGTALPPAAMPAPTRPGVQGFPGVFAHPTMMFPSLPVEVTKSILSIDRAGVEIHGARLPSAEKKALMALLTQTFKNCVMRELAPHALGLFLEDLDAPAPAAPAFSTVAEQAAAEFPGAVMATTETLYTPAAPFLPLIKYRCYIIQNPAA